MAPASVKTAMAASRTQNCGVSLPKPPICRPALSMSIAGATPKEIRSAIESNSAPKSEVAFSRRAERPSSTSRRPHHTMIHAASSSSPIWLVTIEPMPSSRLSAVKLFGIV